MREPRRIIKRFPLITFFVLAYALSWGDYILWKVRPDFPLLFPFGPLIAAILVASATRGGDGLKDIVRRLLYWRVGAQWYAAALLVPVVIALAAVGSNVLLGAPLPTGDRLGPWYRILLLFPAAMVDAPLEEELSWRGFALPGFPAQRSSLSNTLILGALLTGWHFPLGLESPSAAAFMLGTFASAILANWIFYNTGGSVLLVVLYHTAANTVSLYVSPLFAGPDLARHQWLMTAVYCAAAVIVILATGPTLRRPRGHSEGSSASGVTVGPRR